MKKSVKKNVKKLVTHSSKEERETQMRVNRILSTKKTHGVDAAKKQFLLEVMDILGKKPL